MEGGVGTSDPAFVVSGRLRAHDVAMRFRPMPITDPCIADAP